MSNLNLENDVFIIGGGVAGAATALSLQQHGITNIAICEAKPQSLIPEKLNQKDFKIGETVPPQMGLLLAKLGVSHLLESDAHIISQGNCAAWGSSELIFQDYFVSGGGYGWHLNRSIFDASIADTVANRGAILMRDTAVVGYKRLEDGSWSLKLKNKDGKQWHVLTKFVVDASGHCSIFARWQGVRKVTLDYLMGVAAVFTWDNLPPADRYTTVEAAELGWWYSARLPNNRAIVTFMSDRDILHKYQLLKPVQWLSYLAKTQHIKKLLAFGTLKPKLIIKPAFSAYLEQIIGKGWLAVGDAATTFDPLSSAGIYKAIHSGIKAGETIAATRAGNTQALTNYQTQIRMAIADYLEQKQQYYQKETRWSNSTFWQRRQNKVTTELKSVSYILT